MSPEEPLVVVALPDGTAAAFPLPTVIEGRKLAAELGFGARPHQRGRDLNAGAERLLDSKAMAELLGVNDTFVEQMAKDGRLPSIRIGRLLRFEPSVCVARLRVTDGGQL